MRLGEETAGRNIRGFFLASEVAVAANSRELEFSHARDLKEGDFGNGLEALRPGAKLRGNGSLLLLLLVVLLLSCNDEPILCGDKQ